MVRMMQGCRLHCLLALVVACGLSIPVAPVHAQAQATWPEPGTRVRVTSTCDADQRQAERSPASRCSVVGTFVRAQAGALAIVVADSTSRLRLADVSLFEVSRSMRSHRLLGAASGMVVGGAITFVVLSRGGSTSKCDRSANQDALSSTECLGLTVLGGAVVAGLGAVAGGFLRTERWEEVRLERLRVGIRFANSLGIVVHLVP
jgi:hypothetical protein